MVRARTGVGMGSRETQEQAALGHFGLLAGTIVTIELGCGKSWEQTMFRGRARRASGIPEASHTRATLVGWLEAVVGTGHVESWKQATECCQPGPGEHWNGLGQPDIVP